MSVSANFQYNDPNVYELGSVQVKIEIGGIFDYGDGVTDTILVAIAQAIEPHTATMTGQTPELVSVDVDVPETTRNITLP